MIQLKFFKKGDLPINELVKEENVYWENFGSIDQAAMRLNELLELNPNLLQVNPGIRCDGIKGEDDVKNAEKFAHTMLNGIVLEGVEKRLEKLQEYRDLVGKKDLWLSDIRYEKGEISENELKDFEKERIKSLQDKNKLGGKKIKWQLM